MNQPEPLDAAVDRRPAAHVPMNERATLLLGHLGSAVPCTLTDVSLEGCRLRSDTDARIGQNSPVEVAFRLGGASFRMIGRAEWSVDPRDIGVCFTEVGPRWEAELVEALGERAGRWKVMEAERELAEQELEAARGKVERLKEEYEARRSREAAVRAEVEQAARETREANERLAVAKRDLLTAQKAAERAVAVVAAGANSAGRAVRPAGNGPLKEAEKTAPTPDAGITAAQENTAPATRGRDRRHVQRHQVDSTATVFLVDVRSSVRGRIADVSMEGCLIRFEERFPVGIYRRVEVEFLLDGLPFRLPGVVQSIRDRFTAGMRFLDVSERKREQLQTVIEEMGEEAGNGDEGRGNRE